MNISNSGYSFGSNLRNSNPRSQIVNGRPIVQSPHLQQRVAGNRITNPAISRLPQRTHFQSNSRESTGAISNQELLESIQEFQESIQTSVDSIRKDVQDLKSQISGATNSTDDDSGTTPTLSNQEMLYYQNALQQANYTVASIAQSAIASLQRGQPATNDYVYSNYSTTHPQNSPSYNWNSMYPQYYTDDSTNLDQGSHNIQQAYEHYKDAFANQEQTHDSTPKDTMQSIENIIDNTILRTQMGSQPTDTSS